MIKFTIGLLCAIAICSTASAQLINISFRHARLDATKTHDTFDVYAAAGTGYTPDVVGSPNFLTNTTGSWSGITILFDVVIPPGVTLATGDIIRNPLTTTGKSFQNNVPPSATSSTMTDGGITFVNFNNGAGDLSTTPVLLGTVYLNFTGGTISATNQIIPRANATPTLPNYGSFWTNDGSPSIQRSFSLPGSTPLPITLLSFSAVKDGASRSRIDWKTANEQNVSYFDIERGSNAVDFPVVVSHTKAHGTSVDEQNYLAYDFSPATGDNWYRLRTVDNDGTTTYGAPQKVSFGNSHSSVISVMPNPLSENSLLSISTDQAQDAVYQVTDAEGKTVSTGNLTLTTGINTQRLNLQNLAAGTYQVHVHGTSVDGSVKVLKTQ